MEEKQLRFVRLRSSLEDLVGYVTRYDEHIVIEKPLRIDIETYFEESRQILSLQEYLPQSVISIQEIQIPNNDIVFTTPVRQEFVEQYEHVSDFFYNNEHNPINKKKRRKFAEIDELKESQENVVSIIEALAKKDKGPMH